MSRTRSYPKVSVIVPFYNVQNFLLDCINSVLAQTYDNFELILIDDGSTDNSGSICDSVNDRRIRVIHQKNSGVSVARNAGILVANGEYITFIDADDTIDNNMLKCMVQTISSHGSDIAFCNPKKKNTVQANTLFEAISYGECWEAWGKIMKRSTIRYLFNSKISVGEDLLFYYKNYKTNKNFTIIDKNLYHYNLRSGSLMNSETTLKGVSCLDVLLQIINDASLSISLRAFYQAYYIQAYYRMFARSLRTPKMDLVKNKYRQHINEFYKTSKKYRLVNLQLFIKHRLTWIYNIIERSQTK